MPLLVAASELFTVLLWNSFRLRIFELKVTALVAIEALKLLRAAAGDGLAAATGVAPNADACFEGTVKSGRSVLGNGSRCGGLKRRDTKLVSFCEAIYHGMLYTEFNSAHFRCKNSMVNSFVVEKY